MDVGLSGYKVMIATSIQPKHIEGAMEEIHRNAVSTSRQMLLSAYPVKQGPLADVE